jgi:signal transduction histidine kinase
MRIVQEALANVRKHAQASLERVVIERDRERVVATV